MAIPINIKVTDMEIPLKVKPDDKVSLHTDEVTLQTTDDYEKLRNKPTLNGIILEGNVNEIDPTVPDWAKSKTKPAYSAEEVGAVEEDSTITLSEIDQWFKNI